MNQQRVLIVDDEENIVISLEFLMRNAGYTVGVARTGEEALDQIANFAPDLIILDVMLPGIDGFEICRQVRQESSEIKIVMLTAKGRDVEINRGLALGANAYITKPFSTKDLLIQVQEQLRDVTVTRQNYS